MIENTGKLNALKAPGLLRFFCWALILMISLYAFFVFFQNQFYYIDSDTFYYLSIADSLEQNGQFLDLTMSPPQGLATPQNGIVVIYYLIGLFVSSPGMKIQIVVILNYLALLLSIYPLLKITRILKIESFPAQMSILAVYLCGWHMIRFQLSPINDGLFRTGFLWLIYWILQVTINDRNLKQLWKESKGVLVCGCVLSILLIHFRLNAMVIPVAGLLAALLTKNKNVAWIMLVIGILMAVSIVLPYTFAPLSRIQGISQNSWHHIFQNLFLHVRTFLSEFSRAVFSDLGTNGNMLTLVFMLAVAIGCYQGYRKKEYAPLFISLVCIGSFTFLLSFTATPYRMFLPIFILLYLLMFNISFLRSIGYLFAFVVVWQSLMFFCSGDKVMPQVAFWEHVSRVVKTEPSDYLLITNRPHQAYYFTGMSGTDRRAYTWLDIQEKEKIYIAGDESLIKKHKEKIETLAHQNHVTVNYLCLTPDYSDSSGRAVFCVIVEDNQ